ncbi:uncharacterized protein Bfra_000879 [Botrytis fragariae]|uniref:Uncharacterized protein n=1 Tax=Botrytis fragariae TaxID=1964551 RepID=A0A8H6B462_9HELO|nr:uncharacterized protein Bfra_000879 [Botrytis fragariae]KAF5878712.1 hypothetical protein Bfra_000879 [Botrytis fragariae]
MRKLADILPATPEIDCDGEMWSCGESVTDDSYTDKDLVNKHVPLPTEAALMERSALASQKTTYTISEDTSTELD